jgi:hypothetical protein
VPTLPRPGFCLKRYYVAAEILSLPVSPGHIHKVCAPCLFLFSPTFFLLTLPFNLFAPPLSLSSLAAAHFLP